MGSSIKQGQSIFIPFVNGESVPDSQNRPRMYKTVEQFEKNSRVFHGEIPILIEYVPVQKKHVWETEVMNRPFCRDITKVCECVCATESDLVGLKNATALTLEELRHMNGKPVYVQNLERPDRSQWRLCHWDRGKYLVLQGISIQGYLLEDYGETWLAYAAEPPRLDRSAWEPCEYCQERNREVYKTQDYLGLCSFEVAQDGPDEIVVNAYNHNTPLTGDICFSFPVLFCPKCGRPLTDAAWEMLKKRLEGRK